MTSTILFLLPYPLHRAPSQRFRVETYFDVLKKNHISFDADVFLDEKASNILYHKGSFLQKAAAVLKGYFRRLRLVLFKTRKYSHIFIHREAAPLGPPFFEWWLIKVLRKKVIYDFDDAIWIPNVTETNKITRSIKCFWKVKWICKWAYKVSVGNFFLADYARQYNSNVVYNPTCVDAENKYNIIANHDANDITIGWTGSHSTIQFLEVGIPAIKKLKQLQPFRFLVICDQKPEFEIQCMQFKCWRKETEIEDLAEINIGIMPLKEDAWSEGKCGFKLIQYMALGIPAVASPVGVNKRIIDHGYNGYLCKTDEEWIAALTDLVQDKEKRTEWGKRGREKILREYSVASNTTNFLSLFSN